MNTIISPYAEMKGSWASSYTDDSITLGFLGEIYNMAGNSTPALFLADIYKAFGVRGLCNLNGRFLVTINDKVKNKFYLVNDRYGFKRCYYWLDKGKFIFSPEFRSICGLPEFNGKIDEQALADFLYLRFILEDRTFYEEIKLLPAASILTLSNGHLTIEKYWDYSFNSEDSRLGSEAEYLEEFQKILKRAIEMRLEGRREIILPISGGFDSRTIAGMIFKSGYTGKVHALSYGHKNCFDVIYGGKIARVLGYRHEFVPINPDFLARYAEKFVTITNGDISCLNSHMMLFYDYITVQRPLNILTGFLGDVLTGVNFNSKWIGVAEDELILKTFEISSDHHQSLKFYLNRNIYERIGDNTIPTIKKHYHHTKSNDMFFKAHYLTLALRQRRYVAFNIFCYELLGTVLSPFTDNDFMDFALKLPKEYLLDQNLYKKMIVRYLPEVASVPSQKTGRLPLNATILRQGLHWRWERLNRNPLVRATIGRRYAKMNDNYLNSGEAIRTGSRDFVISHIKDNTFLAEYFNMNGVSQMLDEHMSAKSNDYEKITALLTLALWHKVFIEDEGF